MRVLRPVLAAASAVALAVAGTVLIASPAAAADGVVTSTADDGSVGTLRYEIVNSDPGDTITFDPAVFGSPQTITLLPGTIAIGHTLTIEGPGSGSLTVTRGADLTEYPMFAAGPSVVSDIAVSGLTLSRTPSATRTGPAFFSADDELRDLTFTDVVFENQQAFFGAGLAVELLTGKLTVRDSAFHDNTASGSGAALWVASSGGVVDIENTTFDQNAAGDGGGAVHVGLVGAVTIMDSVFTRNTAEDNGGAVSVVGAPSVYVGDSEFGSPTDDTQGNSASLRGGAFYAEQIDGPVDVVNTGFNDNRSTANVENAGGGAVHITDSGSVGIAASIFDHNEAATYGGAVYAELLQSDATVTIFAARFRDNFAAAGGAVYLTEVTESALLLDSTFLANGTFDAGGAVYVGTVAPDTNLTVRGSTFEHNSTNFASGDGAALYVGTNEEVVEIDSSTFFDQSTNTGYGLSVSIGTNVGELRVINSTFDELLDDDSSAIHIEAQGELGRTDILSSTLVGDWTVFEVVANRGVTELVNSIFSAPAGADAVATGGESLDATSSLFSSAFDAGIIISAATNRFSIADMMLGDLADNGGAILTRLPLVGSPARDAGDSDAAYVATTPNDQRGDGFPRLMGGLIDIGAIEVQPVLAATGRSDWMPLALGGALVLLLGAAALGYRTVARRSA